MTIVVIMAARKTKPPKTPKAIMPPIIKNNNFCEFIVISKSGQKFTKIELLLS